MGIALTEDHLELENVAREFLADHKARHLARAQLDATAETIPAFWADLAELGWLGLHVPEEYGGSGYGLPELVVVVEQLGRAVAPGPMVPTVVASAVIAAHGTEEQKSRLLPGLVDGTTVAGVGLGGVVVVDGGLASGDAGVVLGTAVADLLLLRAGDDVLLVPTSAPGVTVTTPPNVDLTRRSGRVTLEDVEADILPGAFLSAQGLARTIVSAEAVGGALDCVESAVGYAKVREQFGRTIGTFQAVKHHCANMLVAAEVALSTVWDAARAASDGDDAAFRYMAAGAASLALPAYRSNSETNIQVHGGIAFTWEHDAHLHLRRAASLQALFGGPAAAEEVLELAVEGVRRESSLDLPPEADALREQARAVAEELATLDEKARRARLIETGYVMPHWPRPYGRAAGAVEQLVIEEEFAKAGIKRPDYSITGWVILTLIQHGTQEQIDRLVEPALRGEEVWCQLFSEPEAGSDAAAVKTRAVRVEGGWRVNGQKVWTSGARECQRGLATVRTDLDAPKHQGITTVVIDMSAPGVEVRPLRQITGGSEFNEVFFTDVFVPDRDVVGEVNQGWTVARATLGNERVSIGGGTAGSAGSAAYTAKLAEKYAEGLPGSRARVGRFLAEEEALRLLNLRRAARSVAGGEPGPEGNVTKLVLAEHLTERAAISAELLGQDVALAEGPAKMVGLMVLAARGMSIAGGTSEITRNQIAERILGLPRDPLVK